MGTVDRSDDTIAAFSSRGPSAIDDAAKPDLVAPGVGIESLSDPASAFYIDARRRTCSSGTVPTSYLPYLSLSGTSMAAPVVSGTVALMLQANPSLTPNAVKAILQYTAQVYAGLRRADAGRRLPERARAPSSSRAISRRRRRRVSVRPTWSRHIDLGQPPRRGRRADGGRQRVATDVMWGAARRRRPAITWGVS